MKDLVKNLTDEILRELGLADDTANDENLSTIEYIDQSNRIGLENDLVDSEGGIQEEGEDEVENRNEAANLVYKRFIHS